MRKRLRIAVALLLVAILGVFTWRVLRSLSAEPKEPSYQGRTLTQWLVEANTTYASFRGPKGSDPRHQAALYAVKSIGTNGIPTLLKMLQAKDPPLKAKLISWANRIRTPMHFQDDSELRSLAQDGFAILGKDAASATPSLLQLAKDKDLALPLRPLFCLPLINPDKQALLPILTQLIHDPDYHYIHPSAAKLLLQYYPDEAEKAGVYDLFPTFRLALTNATKKVDPEAATKAGLK